MHPASRGVLPLSTQGSAQRRNFQSCAPASKVAVRQRVLDRVERIRRALLEAAPHGFHQRVAGIMGFRKERLSREANGADRLTVEVLVADTVLHEEEGRPEAAVKILAELQREVCPVIEMKNGQYVLGLEFR